MEHNYKKEMDSVFYREVQKPNEILTIISVIFVISFFGYLFINNRHLFDGIMLLPVLIFVPFYLLSFFRKIVTEVREGGVYIRVYPFDSPFKSFPFRNIQSCEVKSLSPFDSIRKGRAYGYYYSLKGGVTYNLSADRGVLFKFSVDGNLKEIAIGSHNPEILEAAIRRGIQNSLDEQVLSDHGSSYHF